MSLPDAYLYGPKPKNMDVDSLTLNTLYKSLIVNPISLHVGFAFRVMDQTSRLWGLGKGTEYILLF